jgi:hypothetical protein
VTDLASPVVQVVTSGTDWPAIVAAISGGVVALAGIIFAWRQSKMTITADDQRAVLADKRQIYSKYQATLDDVFTVANILRTEHGPDRPKYLSDLQTAGVAMFNATSDVRLTAPADIASQARTVADTLSKAAWRAAQTGSDVDQDNAVYKGRQELYSLMRTDLGVVESGMDLVPAKR